MNKKIFALMAFLLVFGVLFSSYAYASTKVNINSVRLNGDNLAENKRNFIEDTNDLDIVVSLTALTNLSGIYIQATLTDLNTGNTISDTSNKFNLLNGQDVLVTLSLRLIDSLKRQKDFNLVIRVFNRDGGLLEENLYGIKFTDGRKGVGILDVSIDRVSVNGQIVAPSSTNFIEESDEFFILVEFTALEDLENAHFEAILKDLRTGNVVADATSNFDLEEDTSSLAFLFLRLLNELKDSDSFELTIKMVDAEGNSIQKVYGIRMRDGKGIPRLDVSIDRVTVNNRVVVPSKTNFIDKSNSFDVLVEFKALEDLENAHVEAILKDLRTGNVVADSTSTFDLFDGESTSFLLKLELLNKLKQSNSFELTINIIDEDGNLAQQVYGIAMKEKKPVTGVSEGVFRQLDVSIDSVEVERKVVAENENNFIIVKEGTKELDLDVRLTSLENIKDAHLEAVLTFENGDVVADATTTFDIGKEQSILKRLELPLIGKFEQNRFKLKVKVIDAEGDFEEKFYGLKISQKEFPFIISSISLSPEGNAEAGKNLVVRLSFKNSGVVPLEGINAKVIIPELGISSTKFVDQIKNSGRLSEIREEFVLKILDNAPTGTYTVRSEIFSQFGGESEVKEIPVFVLGKSDQKVEVVNDKLVIKIPILKQNILTNGAEVIYPITLTNKGPDANTYTLLLDGSNWANLRLTESNVFILKPKETKTINIYASTLENLENFKGEQTFLVAIKSDDKVLKNIEFKGNVIAAKKTLFEQLKNILKYSLIGFLVLVVAIGLFIVFRRYMRGDEEFIDEEYYPTVSTDEVYYTKDIKDFSKEILDKANGEGYY